MFVTISLALLLAQSPPPQAPRPPQKPMTTIVAKPDFPAYADACKLAVASGKPIVVFVRCEPFDVPNAIVTRSTGIDGIGEGITINIPDGKGWLSWVDTLPHDADAQTIRRSLALHTSAKRGEVQAIQPSFFERIRERRRPTADGNSKAAGPWPKNISFWDKLQPYRTATKTQAIAVTNGADTITPTPRSAIKAVWQVPGGLEGVTGWHSDLYRYTPNEPNVFVADIDVFNGSNFQANRGYKRSYPDGTVFVDVLSNETGEVFEKRVAEKVGGKWDRYISYKNPTARPSGYFGLAQSCVSCHEGGHDKQPGSGGYATGLIPGGDTIYSDPFEQLEKGDGYTAAVPVQQTSNIGEFTDALRFNPGVDFGRAPILRRRR